MSPVCGIKKIISVSIEPLFSLGTQQGKKNTEKKNKNMLKKKYFKVDKGKCDNLPLFGVILFQKTIEYFFTLVLFDLLCLYVLKT